MNFRWTPLLPSGVTLCVFIFAFACGKSSSGNDPSPSPTASPTIVVTEQPESAAVPFWLASNWKDGGGPVAVRFDSNYNQSLTVDFYAVGVDFGPITSFHFLDSSTLTFFVDGGVGKETIGTFDVKTALIKNKAWGSESSIKAALNGARVSSLVTGLQQGVLYAQTPSSIKSIRYNGDGGVFGDTFFPRTDDPEATAACPVGTITSSALLRTNNNASLALLSTGTANRISILYVEGGKLMCRSSYDFAAGPDTTAQHKPVNIIQNSDGKVFVLYQHDSAPLVIRYDFDGTNLSNPQKVYFGVGNLGKTPLGMIARTNKRLLIGRPDIGAIVEILVKGNSGEQTALQKSSFAKDLTALIAEPN